MGNDKEVRLIDANSVCRSIVESIRYTEEWISEAREQQDTIGLQYASNTYSSLISMLERIQNEPTIEVEPNKDWISVKDRPPETNVNGIAHILAYDKYEGVVKADFFGESANYINGSNIFEISNTSTQLYKVTHWQPLPKPPKENK